MNKIYGLLGHPVEHSLSPAMQNAAFTAAGIDGSYILYDIAPDALKDFLDGLKKSGISGLNVTIPYKIEVKNYLERNGTLDENARRLGAVNTIKIDGDTLCGFNTDGPGFYRSLIEDLKFEPEGKNIFVLGAGGAARAVVMYLGPGPAKISVYDVDQGKVQELTAHYKKYYDAKRIVAVDKGGLGEAIGASNLLVNATPIGMKESDPSPIDKGLLRPGLRVYDLVYNRPVTTLVKEAKSLKLNAVTGLGMLLYQGAISFEIWTGKSAPVAVMRRELKKALKSK